MDDGHYMKKLLAFLVSISCSVLVGDECVAKSALKKKGEFPQVTQQHLVTTA